LKRSFVRATGPSRGRRVWVIGLGPAAPRLACAGSVGMVASYRPRRRGPYCPGSANRPRHTRDRGAAISPGAAARDLPGSRGQRPSRASAMEFLHDAFVGSAIRELSRPVLGFSAKCLRRRTLRRDSVPNGTPRCPLRGPRSLSATRGGIWQEVGSSTWDLDVGALATGILTSRATSRGGYAATESTKGPAVASGALR